MAKVYKVKVIGLNEESTKRLKAKINTYEKIHKEAYKDDVVVYGTISSKEAIMSEDEKTVVYIPKVTKVNIRGAFNEKSFGVTFKLPLETWTLKKLKLNITNEDTGEVATIRSNWLSLRAIGEEVAEIATEPQVNE